MEAMLAEIKYRQWALTDIDWDAPGAETIQPESRPKLKAFMADLCWIEHLSARGFAPLPKKAPDYNVRSKGRTRRPRLTREKDDPRVGRSLVWASEKCFRSARTSGCGFIRMSRRGRYAAWA